MNKTRNLRIEGVVFGHIDELVRNRILGKNLFQERAQADSSLSDRFKLYFGRELIPKNGRDGIVAGKVQIRIERLVGDADTFGYGKTGIEGFGIGFGSGCRTLFDKRNITGFFGMAFPKKRK